MWIRWDEGNLKPSSCIRQLIIIDVYTPRPVKVIYTHMPYTALLNIVYSISGHIIDGSKFIFGTYIATILPLMHL